jgi:hypothetical protein
MDDQLGANHRKPAKTLLHADVRHSQLVATDHARDVFFGPHRTDDVPVALEESDGRFVGGTARELAEIADDEHSVIGVFRHVDESGVKRGHEENYGDRENQFLHCFPSACRLAFVGFSDWTGQPNSNADTNS